MPFGTRGGTRIRYTFPVDGEYVIRVRLARDLNESMPPYADPQHLEVSLDGEQLQVFTLAAAAPAAGRGRGAAPQPATDAQSQPASATPAPQPAAAAPAQPADPPQPPRQRPGAAQAPEAVRLTPTVREQRNRADQNWDVRVPVKAGEHEIVVAFLKKTAAVDETPRLPFLRPFPAGNNVPETRMGAALRSVEISGPPRHDRCWRYAEPPPNFRLPPCRQRDQPTVMCQDNSLDVDAACVSASGHRCRSATIADALRRGARAGWIRSGYRARAEAIARQP